MPTLADLFAHHGLSPTDLDELYVSLGPGSFTGLRIAIATAKILSLTIPGLKLVGVPTMDVLAHQHADTTGHVAVCMNIKRGTMYTGVFNAGQAVVPPGLRTVEALLADAPRPLAIVSEVDTGIAEGEGVQALPPESAKPDAAATWLVGRSMAQAGCCTKADNLMPLYIREPEAVTLWNELGRD